MKRIVLAFLFTCAQLAQATTAVKVGSNVQQSGTYFRENYIKNGTFEQNNKNSLTDANAIATVSASSPMSGTYSLDIDAGTSGHLVKMLGRTMTQTGGNCEATFTYTGDASLYKAYVLQSSTKVSAELTLQNAGTNFIPVSLIFPCGAGTAPDVTIEATSASAAAFKIDDVYAGQPVNIGTVAQASFFGGMEQAGATGCVYAESTSTGLTDFKDLGTGSGCNAWTVSGSVTATGTNDHRPIASNMAPGMYQIVIGANFFSSASAQSCYFRLSDGTTTYQPQTIYPGSAASASLAVPTMSYHVNYTTAQSSVTFKLQASDDGSGECRLANGAAGANTSWKIYYFPSAAQTVVNMNQVRPPTTQRLTSGTAATYTTPTGVTHIVVKVVGGGGGGSGTGSSGPGTGGTGGTSTFAIPSSTTLLSVTGGAGGAPSADGGIGGTGTITSPAVVVSNTDGGKGGGSSQVSNNNGGMGGSNPMGGSGGGGGGGASAGLAGVANTGGGGGGGGSTSFASGSGGGAGGYAVAQITSPSATYTYSIGAGGTAGAAGTSGFAGGAGGSGYIEVTEYYGNNMPLLVGGVVARDNTAGVTTINTVVSKSADYTATDVEETILVDSSGATRTITLPAAANYKGKKYEIVQTSTSNQVIIDGNASETICGSTTIRLSGVNDSVTIQSDGTNWKGLHGSCFVSHSINGTSGGVVSNELGDWVSGNCTNAAPFVCTLMTGVWSVAPQCTGAGTDASARMYQAVTTTSSVSVYQYTDAGSSVNNAPWQIVCQGPR